MATSRSSSNEDGKKRRIAIQSTNRTGNRTSNAPYKENCELFNLSEYNKMHMEGDTLVICQAMVTMEELAKFALSRKLVPKVVAEFRKITVGGAISGASLESTSHKYGQFMDTVAWVKVRKGDGTILQSNRGDSLWCSVSGTYGTMGIVLEAAIECVSAKPFVQVSYHVFDSIRTVTNALMTQATQAETTEEDCFLEGLHFPKELIRSSPPGAAVMMHGHLVGSFESSDAAYSVGWKALNHGGPFYYEHVQDLVQDHLDKATSPYSEANQPFFMEYIKIEDFLFRYDDGAFWMARPMAFEWSKFFSYLPFIVGLFIASYRWVRKVTGSLFVTERLFRMLKRAPPSVVASKMVVQDLYMPSHAAIDLVTWVRQSVPLTTPIWLCPVRANTNQDFTPSYNKTEKVLLNCGIYGRVPDGRGRIYTQQLEANCLITGGRKMLYAQNHYKEGMFWEVLNRKRYEELRKEHDAADYFPDIYEKTCPPVPDRSNSMMEWVVSLFL